MFGIANNVQDFLDNRMKSWKVQINTSEEKIGEVDIRRGIFQGDSLSPLFALCMVTLTWLLRRALAGYDWGNKGFKLNHLLFMDAGPYSAQISYRLTSMGAQKKCPQKTKC